MKYTEYGLKITLEELRGDIRACRERGKAREHGKLHLHQRRGASGD